MIGAGPAGLCAIKELLDKRHQVTCFEQGQEIGGAFACGSDKGVFDSTVLTMERLDEGRFRVPPRHGEESSPFDHAAVCSRPFQVPHLLEMLGLDIDFGAGGTARAAGPQGLTGGPGEDR